MSYDGECQGSTYPKQCALVSEQYDEWMASGVQEYTEAGNMRPPSRKMIVEWVLTAWSRLSTDHAIAKSFTSCALNLAVDGSEDSEIHYFKKGQPREAGAEQLEAQLSVLDELNLPNPFQVITDSDIEETNDENKITLKEDSDIDVESLKMCSSCQKPPLPITSPNYRI